MMILLLFLLANANGVQMDQPETVFALRGETPTFHCQGNGSILWHINNTLYDFRNAEHFARKGVLLEASYIEDRTSSLQGITFRTSASDNNNTQFSCTVFGPGSEIHTSNRSTLIVIDVSNLKLSRLEADNFSVTWDKAYAPTEFTVEEYSITVVNQDGQILQRGSVDAAPGRLDYSYTYAEPNHPDHGPVCLRLVFSVVAVADGKSSQGESVSWSGPERNLDVISGGSCQIINPQSVKVSFAKPEVCSFQTALFVITLLEADTASRVSTLHGVVSNGGGKRETRSLMVLPGGVVAGKEYVATIEVRVGNQTSRSQARCSEFELQTEGVMRRKSESDLSRTEIAVVLVVAVVAVAVCTMNGILIAYVIYRRHTHAA